MKWFAWYTSPSRGSRFFPKIKTKVSYLHFRQAITYSEKAGTIRMHKVTARPQLITAIEILWFPATEKPIVDYTFDNIRDKQVISESPDGIVGKLVGKFSQSTYSPKCQKGIEFTNGQGHIEFDGSKIDAMKKDAMTISAWIRLSRNDRVNTIYGWAGQKGSHHLSIKPIGSPNAAVHWLLKMPNGKVVFDITTEPVIPAGQ